MNSTASPRQPMPEVPYRLITNVNLWRTLHIEHSGCNSSSERAVIFALGQFMAWGDNGGDGCFATPAEVGRVACLSENTAQQKRSALRAQGWLYPAYVNGRRTTYACAAPEAAWQAFTACEEHGRCRGERKDGAHLRRHGDLYLPRPPGIPTLPNEAGLPRFVGDGSPVIWGTNSPLEPSTEGSNSNSPWGSDDPWGYQPTGGWAEEPPF